jgi:transcriptional regulator with XRE-family HTH domain
MATSDRGTSPKTGDIELGKKIAARREELGMSRKELAEATSLSYPYIAQIETGYRLPSTKHQVILSKVLGLSLDELFGTGEELPQMPERLMVRSAGTAAAPTRRRRPSIDDAIEHAAQELEGLPSSVRLEALSRLQLRIMQGVTEDQSRQRS